jgi:hypothetical protein
MYDAMLDHKENLPDLTLLDRVEQPVLEQALAKKPEDRFPTCVAFIQALEAARGLDSSLATNREVEQPISDELKLLLTQQRFKIDPSQEDPGGTVKPGPRDTHGRIEIPTPQVGSALPSDVKPESASFVSRLARWLRSLFQGGSRPRS